MSELEQNNVNEFEGRLDKLADGELNDSEVRELLLTLEAQPDAWRRCALAFVEAQTLRRDLGSIAIGRSANDDDVEYELVPARQASRGVRLPAVGRVALAASLLLAFTAGTSIHSLWPNQNSDPRGNAPQVLVATTDGNATETEGEPETTAGNANSTDDRPPMPRETLMVSIPSDEGEAVQSVEVPLIDSNPEALETFMAQQPAVLSDAELTTLKMTGHEVEQQRVFYPLKLNDGRQAIVPLDIVRLRNTGGFQ
jgi:hypothetical protein